MILRSWGLWVFVVSRTLWKIIMFLHIFVCVTLGHNRNSTLANFYVFNSMSGTSTILHFFCAKIINVNVVQKMYNCHKCWPSAPMNTQLVGEPMTLVSTLLRLWRKTRYDLSVCDLGKLLEYKWAFSIVYYAFEEKMCNEKLQIDSSCDRTACSGWINSKF